MMKIFQYRCIIRKYKNISRKYSIITIICEVYLRILKLFFINMNVFYKYSSPRKTRNISMVNVNE